MESQTEPQPKKTGRRRWLRRIGLALLAIVAVLAVFHRPIVFRATKFFVVRLAKEQKLDLEYNISGSIFTTLRITNLRARPIEPGPVQRLEVGALNLRYSLIGWLKRGFPGLLKDVEMSEVFVVIDPKKFVPREKPVKSRKDAKFPALVPDRLMIANANFTSLSPSGDTELAGFFFELDPSKSGELKIRTLNIPGVRRWENVTARTTYQDRKMVLSDLALGSGIQFSRLNLDLSKLGDDQIATGLEGRVLDAPLSLTAIVTDLNKANRVNLQADVAQLKLPAISDYFGLGLAIGGEIPRITVAFQGEPERPDGWAGNLNARVNDLAFQNQPLGTFQADLLFRDGHAAVDLGSELDPTNGVKVNVHAKLPAALDQFPQTTASGNLVVNAGNLANLAPARAAKLQGGFSVNGKFELVSGQLSADFTATAAEVSSGTTAIEQLNLTAYLKKDVGGEKRSSLADLVAEVRGSVGHLRFGDYTTDRLSVILGSVGGEVTLETLSLAKGPNVLEIKGSYLLPEVAANWQGTPIALNVNLNAPELSAFIVPGSSTQLSGQLNLTGEVRTVRWLHNGTFNIDARNVAFKGLEIRNVFGDVNLVDSVAYVPNLGVYFDDLNVVNVGGQLPLAPPFAYSAWAEIGLGKLAVFAPLLSKPESPAPKIAGAVAISWSGKGQALRAAHSGTIAVRLEEGVFGATTQKLNARATGTYSPTVVDISSLEVSTSQGNLALSAHWEDKRLGVKDLTVRQGERTVLSGTMEIPLDPFATDGIDVLIPPDAVLSAELTSKDVNLKLLFEQLGQAPLATGLLNANIVANGTRRTLVANVNILAEELKLAAADRLAPAKLSIDLSLRNNRLLLATSIDQRQARLLDANVDLPIDVAQIASPDLLDPRGRSVESLAHSEQPRPRAVCPA